MLPDHFVEQDIAVDAMSIRVSHGGEGSPLLLLHGYPQTRHMWHRVAPALSRHHHVVCADLRGYGDSAKPPGGARQAAYAKRAMADDMVAVMAALGYRRFAVAVAGHDRGARVAHRLALDHADRVTRLCVMDIAPTRHMFATADRHFATGYYHWFFLIQPDGLPDRLIGADPEYWLREKLRRWAAPGAEFDDGAVREYLRCFAGPEGIRASCDDYRAAAGIDLEHDEADFGRRRVDCPLLVLWGEHGFVHRSYDVLDVWRQYAGDVSGHTVPSGHFLPEEAPAEVSTALLAFLEAS
ncbi:MAG: alpha/beta hydrolase [Zoogloeaceae bacterium]|nr:alpha/beta hydrolase [Rhodocyclaceae bacterium]MCP5237044.1 alpha/beta hydrolase [Zoogloeaceae bacterium]